MSGLGEHVDAGWFLAYVEGRLEAKQAKQVEGHVERCGPCRAELALARRYAETPVGASVEGRSADLKSAFAMRAQERLDGAVRTEPRARSRRRSPLPPWISRGLLAASVAIIGFGIYQMGDSMRPSREELGRQIRAEAPDEALTLTVREVPHGRFELQWKVPAEARDLELRVIASDGSLLLERSVEGDAITLDSSEFASGAESAGILVQLLAKGPAGESLRSVPQALP
jgi:hypothetical protein